VHIEKSEQDMEQIRFAVSRNQLTELLQLSEEQIAELASCMYMKQYPVGEIVVKKGDPGNHFFVVHEGVAENCNFENEQSGKWAVRTRVMVRKMRGVAG
jgi:signal-transduction protein with cAMP-binding, CBS, and nucleotidyltransferase domain